MALLFCSLTGVDETMPLVELSAVSDLHPFAEWGFLYSPKRAGTPGRYPSVARIQRAFKELPSQVRVALHVCGAGVPQMLAGEPAVSDLVGLVHARGGRVQLNFNATEGEVDLARLRNFMLARPGLDFITQHNANNETVLEALQGVANHSLLFDASLGRGIAAKAWSRPLDNVACGYAGGLGPETLARELPRIYEAADGAEFWIDMEGRLRDADDRFSMSFARQCLAIVEEEASRRLQTPPRRRCEGLAPAMSQDGQADFEAMLRRLVHATRNVTDPQVATVRDSAASLLNRKGRPGILRSAEVAPRSAPRARPH